MLPAVFEIAIALRDPDLLNAIEGTEGSSWAGERIGGSDGGTPRCG